MATVTTLAPIAAQVARVVSLEALFPRGAIDTALRDHRSGAQSGEAELPEEVKAFFGHYCVVVPMPPLANEQAWKQRAAELPLPLIAGILELRANPPLPELVNTSGDPLELVTSHYRIRDRARVVVILGRELEKNGDGSYSWVDDRGTSLAHVEVTGGKLRVRVNSRNHLKAAQQLVEALLGDTIERSLEAHQDVGQAVRAHQGQVAKTRPNALPLELAPEVAAQFHDAVLAKLRSTLNDPIPQFKGKTLRQLARSVEGRPDAISWLREQERILKSDPQLGGLDMRPLWQELALPFQGLETDPPR